MIKPILLRITSILITSTCFTVANAQFWQIRNAPILGESPGSSFGASVSLSSDGLTIAASGTYNSEAGANTGHTQVFTWNGANWIQKGTDIDGINVGEMSGTDISLSGDGNTVIIGIPYSEASWQSIGKIRVYEWNGIDWIQKGSTISGDPDDEVFGNSVAINHDGSTIAVCSPNSHITAPYAGAARVYSWNGNEWIQKGITLLGTEQNDSYGIDLEMDASGNRIIVSNNKGGNGQVFVYQWQDSSWVQVGQTLTPPSGVYNFGTSVDISATGQHIVIGAKQNTSQPLLAGKTYVFNLNGNNWTQRGIAITGEDAQDKSGYSTGISDYGDIVAIGSPENDDVANNSGSVRVFRWTGNTWSMLGLNIDGEQEDDMCGLTVSLSGDGTVVAVSSASNNSGGNGAGYVRVFESANAGISEWDNSSFSLNPNPANAFVTLTTNEIQEVVSVTIHTITGKHMAHYTYSNVTEAIVPLPVDSGTYLITIQTGETHYTTRVVKQ